MSGIAAALPYFLLEKNRYLTSAKTPSTRTVITKIQTRPIPHIIGPLIIPFMIANKSLSSAARIPRKRHRSAAGRRPSRPVF
jgi:hypothetical protein